MSMLPWERLQLPWPWHAHAAPIADGSVTVQMGAGAGFGALQFPQGLLIAVSVAYAAIIFYCGARFVVRWMQLSVLANGTESVVLTGDAARAWKRWSDRFGLGKVELVSSTKIFAPITMGIVRTRVMMPASMLHLLAKGDLDTAIAHEFAHIQRGDFAKNLVYELLSLGVSYHPGLWLTRQRMMETREMVCDKMAAEFSGSHDYAQSLLRLARVLLQGRSVRVPHAIGVFDANTLERRLMKLTETKREVSRVRRNILLGACVVVAIAATGSAMALRLAVDQAGAENKSSSPKAPHTVSAEEMQKYVLTKVNPVYPREAKEAGITGTVVLDAVINKTGEVENLKVVSGPRELQQSALDAVRQWTYKPVMVDGEPVEVETTINVTYSLAK
jgi:TonB family protein